MSPSARSVAVAGLAALFATAVALFGGGTSPGVARLVASASASASPSSHPRTAAQEREQAQARWARWAQRAQRAPGSPEAAAAGGQLSAEGLRACLADVATDPVHVRYDFVKGRDGKMYLMNSDEADPQGWLDTLVGIRESLVPMLALLEVAEDNTISDPEDARLSQTEFAQIARCLTDPVYSGVNSLSARDAQAFAGATGCRGQACFVSSRDYYAPRNWRQQNVHYVLHELCHVAMSAPSQERAHTLEFFRVFRVLTRAAVQLGPKVYDPAWFAWDVEQNRNVLGAWIGTERWWRFARATLSNGFRWLGTRLVPGRDPYAPGTGSLVRVA